MPKQCGSCTMCCKLPQIPELNKPLNKWCTHCAPGRGCTVYAERPGVCREFECLWLQDPAGNMGDELRPDRCKVIFSATEQPDVLQAMVDPSFPNAIEKPAAKALVSLLNRAGIGVVVMCGNKRSLLAETSHATQIMQRVGFKIE